jgi:chromate transporter
MTPAMRPIRPYGWLAFNLKVGLLTFGTGSVMPLYQRRLVEEARALTADEFQEALTLSQLLPGPYLVSLTMYLGARLFGTALGALGVLALCLPGAVWGLTAMLLIPVGRPEIQAVLAGFAIGSAVLIADLVLRLRSGLSAGHVAGTPAGRGKHARRVLVALAVAALSLARVPLPTVTLAGAAAGLIAEFVP